MQRGGKIRIRATGRQLEAMVHTSLPPLVHGPLRAYLRVCVSAISWEYSIGPPASKLCVGVKWWGEESPGTIFRVPVQHQKKQCSAGESTTLAFYPVRAALTQLKAYLHDMKALKLSVGLGHMTEDSMVIGRCTIPDLSGLSELQPYEDSLPIISSRGHVLGRLHIQMEIQVAKAGQTRLMNPTTAVDTLDLPGFTVGPGVPSLQGARQKKPHELRDPEPALGTTTKQKRLSTNSTAVADFQTTVEAAASHKAALLAKYIDHRVNPLKSTHEEVHVVSDGQTPPTGDKCDTLSLGVQQREVIAELIERGERLRDAMVAAVLKSGQGGGGDVGRVGGERGGGGLGRGGGDKRGRRGRKYVVGGEKEGYEMSEEKQDVRQSVYSSEEEIGVDDGKEFSMDESDYPLGDPALLEQQLYRKSIQKKTSQKKVDAGVQTLPPSPPITSPPLPSHSQHSKSSGAISLAPFFSGESTHKSVDKEILEAVGMDRLTLLGRVTSCRVVIESLAVDSHQLATLMTNHVPKRPPHTTAKKIGTFFVEYHFPTAAGRGSQRPGGSERRGGVRLFPSPTEVVRVASKKIKNGVVHFGHRSVFAVSMVGHMTRRWWHDVLVFNIYHRPPTDRAPFLLGKARVPFRQWLMTGASSHVEVDVTSSGLGGRGEMEEGRGHKSEKRTLGKLAVCVQLLCGRGDGSELPSGVAASTDTGVTCTDARGVEGWEGGGVESEKGADGRGKGQGDSELKEEVNWSRAPPIRVKEVQASSAKVAYIDKQPTALQLLLMVPEAINVKLPMTTTEPQSSPPPTRVVAPNCYLVCRLFCANPHPNTNTMWATSNPHFNFKQVYSLYLTPSLLEQVCNNFTIVEVWHKTPGTSTEDELLGLVKLSLHQFYLAFSDDSSASLCLQSQLPVVAIDSYCPVISPFTGNEQGHLAVMLAMGSAQQIVTIQQQFAAGSYILHRPFSKSHSPPAHTGPVTQQQTQIGGPVEEKRDQSLGPIHHTFDVTVSGVCGLSVFNSTVWGEADCFIQYQFPSIAKQSLGAEGKEGGGGRDIDVSLQPFRTNMTLCVPNPTFAHETHHTLSLPPSYLIQRAIMRSCATNGGVTFELWRRFYYPNIRDQLIAKASLPVAKLCALVSMQRMAGPTVQSFSLPMQLVQMEAQDGSGGTLEVIVQYQALLDDREQMILPDSHKGKTHVTLAVEVRRATGLKDAALLVAQRQPVPLGFAAEVGTNNYARVSFSDFLEKEKRTTKTVMRTFAPDFSHSFEFALPLVLRETVHPYIVAVPLAQRLSECSAVLEIWHEIPKNDPRPAPVAPGVVFGRRLAPAFRDVCLGHAVIPLVRLLEKEAGVCGWFPLHPPVHTSNIVDSAPEIMTNPDTPTALCYVGGVEVSLSFSSDEDRKFVIARGVEMGWKLSDNSRINTAFLDKEIVTALGEKSGESSDGGGFGSSSRWRFSVKATKLWVPMETITIAMSEDPAPYMYCFLRYKFFDSDAVETVPRALSYCREGRGCYQLNHHATLTITGSHNLGWYIAEESIEIEVWSCPTRRRGTGDHPDSENTLLGTAVISLHPLTTQDSISGSCPMFKAGEVSLGGQTLAVQIEKAVVPVSQEDTTSDVKTVVEILDASDGDEFIPLKPASERLEVKAEEGGGEQDGGEDEEDENRFKDMFEARVVIHQALHLPMMTDKTQEREWPPCAYVTLHPHPTVDKIVTEVVPSSVTPHWNHRCLTHIPNLYLDPHCPGLEFQVWDRVCDTSPSTDGQVDDSYIGCARVDLSTLALGLPQISGWYNIMDFGGQIQGQVKVSVVPSQGWGLPAQMSPSQLPHTHVMLPTLSTTSTEHPAPSFIETSSSVLFRRLRDDLNELDQIKLSSKTHALVNDTTVAPDLKSISSDLTTPPPTVQLSTSIDTSITTTQTSLSLSYSSSGPTLEYTRSHNNDPHVELPLKEMGSPATLAYASEPELSSDSASLLSSSVYPPHKDPVKVRDNDSISSNLSSQTDTQPPSNQDTHPLPASQEAHISCKYTVPSETSSLHVAVGDIPLEPASLTSDAAHSLSSGSPLTDVSTCDDSSPEEAHKMLEQHCDAMEQKQCDVMEGKQAATLSLTTKQSAAQMREDVGESLVRGNGDRGVGDRDREVVATVPQSETLHSSNGAISTVDTRGVTVHVSDTDPKERPICENRDDDTVLGQLPTVSSCQPSHKCSHAIDHLPSRVHKMPEVCLPNFFMPPQELERTMKVLRASTLARPPPRTLFEGHCSSQHQLDYTHDSCTTQSSAVRTLEDVNHFLKSRRASGRDETPSSLDQCQSMSTKAVQRLSRIFVSQPLQTNKQ